MAKEYYLYISHSWKKSNELDRLRLLLQNRGYFPVVFLEASPDQPINSANEYYIRRKLSEKISDADVLLVMAGVYATHSDWIRFELEVAKQLRIPIIGIKPRGQQNISRIVQEYAVEIVNWNTESVVAAVREFA